jgi:hypothetical protein
MRPIDAFLAGLVTGALLMAAITVTLMSIAH